MKFGPILRFAPLLLVLTSGVSGLRPRRNLLPDDGHAFLRRGDDGPDQLPPIILPPTGHRHLTITGDCEACCINGEDGCYLCKTSKSGKKHEVKCTPKATKSRPSIHNGHDDVEDTGQCGHNGNLFSSDIWHNCFHEGKPCDAIGRDGTQICSTDDYCAALSPPYEPPYGEEFCEGVDPEPDQTCACSLSVYYTESGGDGRRHLAADDPSSWVMACSQPDGYLPVSCPTLLPCDPVTFYRDSDDDGFGDPDTKLQACTAPEGYVADNTDCDDTESRVNRALHSTRRLNHHLITVTYGNETETGTRRLGGATVGGVDNGPRALDESLALNYGPGGACYVCGNVDNYACSNNYFSNWNTGLGDGVRSFTDPTLDYVCAIEVTVFGTCFGFPKGIGIYLNNHSLGSVSNPTVTCYCGPSDCLSATTGVIQLDSGIYVEGGTNEIKLESPGTVPTDIRDTICIDRVELDLIECSCPV